MANLVQSAKSGSDWSRNELFAYDISIQSLSPSEFFPNGAEPSLDHFHPALLTLPTGFYSPALPPNVINYLGYLDLATSQSAQDSTIDDFVVSILCLLGFNDFEKFILTHYDIPLCVCGDTDRAAMADVCLIHYLTLVLLVIIGDKVMASQGDVEAQVIAEAIATFQSNN